MRISDWSSDVCSSDLELEEDLRQLKARLERISRTGSGKIIRLRAVAAVFLLLAGVGLCWYLVADRPSSSLFSGYISEDVHPGRSRAVLTLAEDRKSTRLNSSH